MAKPGRLKLCIPISHKYNNYIFLFLVYFILFFEFYMTMNLELQVHPKKKRNLELQRGKKACKSLWFIIFLGEYKTSISRHTPYIFTLHIHAHSLHIVGLEYVTFSVEPLAKLLLTINLVYHCWKLQCNFNFVVKNIYVLTYIDVTRTHSQPLQAEENVLPRRGKCGRKWPPSHSDFCMALSIGQKT